MPVRGIVLATLGGVLGAALSLGLVYAIGILLADGEMGHDLVVLVAMLFVALPAGLLGAGGGGLLGWRIAVRGCSSRERALLRGLAAAGAVVAAVAVYRLWFHDQLQSGARRAAQRRAWLATRHAVLRDRPGLMLSARLQACVRANGAPASADAVAAGACGDLNALRAGVPMPEPDTGGADEGWRWSFIPHERSWRIIVAPDPQIAPGPLFELDERLRLMRRESPGASPYVVWTGLPLAARYRECLVIARERMEAVGGAATSLEALPAMVSETTGCRGIDARPANGSEGALRIRVKDASLPGGVDVTFEPVGGGFVLHLDGGHARYLVDAEGRWHTTSDARAATAADPPPPACELDPTLPCSGPN